MDIASFHRLRAALQENAHPASAQAAVGIQRTLHDALMGSRLFAEVELGRTQDPDQMIVGVCRCADRVLPWEAGMGVERLWRRASADTAWEAHGVACTESLMEFEGAVTVDDSAHYVTVHLVAQPAQDETSAPEGDGQPATAAPSTVDA